MYTAVSCVCFSQFLTFFNVVIATGSPF